MQNEINEIKDFIDHIEGRVGEAAYDQICDTIATLQTKYDVLKTILKPSEIQKIN